MTIEENKFAPKKIITIFVNNKPIKNKVMTAEQCFGIRFMETFVLIIAIISFLLAIYSFYKLVKIEKNIKNRTKNQTK